MGRFDTSLREVAALFAGSVAGSLPVLDDGGRYLGILGAHELMDAISAGEDTEAGSLSDPVEDVRQNDPSSRAVRLLDRGVDAVAVVDEQDTLVGWVRHRDVLAALSGPRVPDRPAVPTQDT